MYQLVNPTGFRPGKVFLWNKNVINLDNNQTTLTNNKNINISVGLERIINNVLRRNNYWIVKSSMKYNSYSGIINCKVLYYPLIMPIVRKKIFPTYGAFRSILYKVTGSSSSLEKLLYRLWFIKMRIFILRFIRTPNKKKNINKKLTLSMWKGNKNLYLKKEKWINSKKLFNSKQLGKQISKRIGARISIKTSNVFFYLWKKFPKLIQFKNHQQHFWNKKYSYHKARFTAYYDLINSIWLLCRIPFSEELVMDMIKQGLKNMHRRKIRPKQFFYFIDAIIKNMPQVRNTFNAFRILIRGKLRGGTSRTSKWLAGFGDLPRQSLEKNVRYAFGDILSKYGSFGIKLITWRKSKYEFYKDKAIKKRSQEFLNWLEKNPTINKKLKKK
jgi:hypothetical protein